jgi:WASH complex subunit 7
MSQVLAFEDDLAQKRPVDLHIQKVLSFIIEHEGMLCKINETTRNAIADANETHYRPIRIAADQYIERVFPQDLISSENEILRKVYIVLVFLIDEVHELKDMAEANLYGPLLMFGQTPPDVVIEEENITDDDRSNIYQGKGYREKMIGKFLPKLQEISNFIDRCYSVTLNIVQQLSSLINAKEALYRATFETTHLISVFSALGDILSVLITLDCIIEQNDMLQESWSYYKSLISYARADPSHFGTDEAGVTKFERLLVSIDQSVMIGAIFKGCIEQNFEEIEDIDSGEMINIRVRSNEIFLNELLFCIKNLLDTSLSVIGTSNELFERYNVMNCIALYALYRRILPSNIAPDGKLHKNLWSVQKTVPFVIVAEKVIWNLGEFLQLNASFEIKKPDPPNPAQYIRTFINTADSNLGQKTNALTSQVAAWLVLIESKFQGCLRHEISSSSNDSVIQNAFDTRGSILLKGLALASKAEYLAKSCLATHSILQIPMSKNNLNDVALLVENLKAIEFTFIRKDLIINEQLVHILKVHSHEICGIIEPIRVKLESLSDEATRTGRRTKVDSARYDLISTLKTIENILHSSDLLSTARQAVLKLSSEIIIGSKLFNEKEANRINSYIRRLCAISNILHDMRKVCKTSFLYFETGILGPIMQNIYNSPTEASRLQYIMGAFSDGIRLFPLVEHMENVQFYMNYRDILKNAIFSYIVTPLCKDIETDLRIHIHTKHLDHMASSSPKTENKPLRPFLDIPPLRMLGLIISIRNEVTHYLDLNFYNLTTVALHDWRTYSDMRSLAAEKFGIVLMENFLPMGSLDQGLDVLQIMRNIHIFVSRFTYNMNTQQFIEYRPDKASKHLNTIKIQSIAASIRQHGLGVLNTTVNFTYQFLAQKFHIFSQFLFDDYIRAHLSREHRWFKKHKNEEDVNNMYPYDRALKLVRDIRKLGVNEQGKTFLDQFRILITEIGNALGYVRMVRSASMYYCSEAVKFLPEVDDAFQFEKHTGANSTTPTDGATDAAAAEKPIKGAGFSAETTRSAKILDNVITCLVDNFGEGSDYFKVLVNVFQSVLLTDAHDHLKTFYMIVPCLCISWLEASLQAKEAVYKVVRGPTKEMYYTDDGFAMGIAYCLAILKQTRKNESLHWIDTMRMKHKIDQKKLEEQQSIRAKKEAKMKEQKEKKRGSILSMFTGSKKTTVDEEEDHEDHEEVHSLQMTGKRLEANRRETETLFYAMAGAGIFFRRTDLEN